MDVIKISPKVIKGKWMDGFALDYHTVSSEYIGDDEYGHPQYDTKRTPLGELLYRLKYHHDRSVIDMIVTTTVDFVTSRVWPIDLIIPVPPSSPRSFQPVIALAEQIAARLQKPFSDSAATKVKDIPELKNIYDFNKRTNLLAGAFRVSPEVKGRTLLLFDDLYRSGATLNAVCSQITAAGAEKVYALALTMTRSKR